MIIFNEPDEFFDQARKALNEKDISAFKEIVSFYKQIDAFTFEYHKEEAEWDRDWPEFQKYYLFENCLWADYNFFICDHEYTGSASNEKFLFSDCLLAAGFDLKAYPRILIDTIDQEGRNFFDVDYRPFDDIPDGRVTAYLVNKGADVNLIFEVGTALDLAYSCSSSYPNITHPQAIEVLKKAGVKRVLEFSEEEWLGKISFAHVCRQGILKFVKKHILLSLPDQTHFGESLFTLFSWSPGISYWRGEHAERDHEAVLHFLLNLGFSFNETGYDIYHFVSCYFTSLKNWDRQAIELQKPNTFWGIDTPQKNLTELYCPSVSVSRVMGLLLNQGCEINSSYTFSEINEIRITALDLILKGIAEMEESLSWILKYQIEAKKYQLVRPEYELHEIRIKIILQKYLEAKTFLLAHGAKTYAELQA
jgi:hypothetical protein